ncbi:MAG TPA: YbaB/EbfC family nucleoid-associated protein [Candidatus Marinimicrobia bacterium]|nr:MAG: YbaB/EbfC family nucleoid-associated protein [Candidatus Marinimicrobia bacterium CG1_02_48_14]PIZ65076.1 MAG: YbaB/EbfC family nucleoid-associated protein [Candidatus Marinimicrobia bacterium CG_4_10_14_0_2_um_filter_48_9]PJA51788.1 MAG: YbaB/EbfC family nucleoid-associated protein [Candidatus Marinimicrobia bacterium CG_4_9_14_3_um_filter_48_9]HCW76296.1 YbaB/EbfC family nucleoid-associated protein [Candidatus Neomarinimicrobiota bacterium]
MFPKGGMGGLMKQAQQLQQKMADAQEELVNIEVEGSAGGGMVNVRANGKLQILGINIDPEVLRDEKEMIEDLVLAAVNQALTKAQDAAQEHMGKVTGGMLPPGMKIPGF